MASILRFFFIKFELDKMSLQVAIENILVVSHILIVNKIVIASEAWQSYSIVIARNEATWQFHPHVIASEVQQSHKKKCFFLKGFLCTLWKKFST